MGMTWRKSDPLTSGDVRPGLPLSGGNVGIPDYDFPWHVVWCFITLCLAKDALEGVWSRSVWLRMRWRAFGHALFG